MNASNPTKYPGQYKEVAIFGYSEEGWGYWGMEWVSRVEVAFARVRSGWG